MLAEPEDAAFSQNAQTLGGLGRLGRHLSRSNEILGTAAGGREWRVTLAGSTAPPFQARALVRMCAPDPII